MSCRRNSVCKVFSTIVADVQVRIQEHKYNLTKGLREKKSNLAHEEAHKKEYVGRKQNSWRLN
jgi:hypothetical protein